MNNSFKTKWYSAQSVDGVYKHQVCLFLIFVIILSVRGGEFGNSLGSLGDGMLGKFTRKEETNSGLDLTGREGGLLVVSGKLGGLKGDTVKDVVDEGVEDRDTSLGNTSLRVDLFKDLVDVRRVTFDSLLVGFTSLLGGLSSFLSGSLGHFVMLKFKCYSKL